MTVVFKGYLKSTCRVMYKINYFYKTVHYLM